MTKEQAKALLQAYKRTGDKTILSVLGTALLGGGLTYTAMHYSYEMAKMADSEPLYFIPAFVLGIGSVIPAGGSAFLIDAMTSCDNSLYERKVAKNLIYELNHNVNRFENDNIEEAEQRIHKVMYKK